MKKKILLVFLTISAGIIFTFFILNKKNIYAKEEYLIYAFQVGAYEKYDNAKQYSEKLSSSIILKEDNLYKVYVSMYKDIDIVNKMIVYFENNDINIYLKSFSVNKDFYNNLDNFEKIIANSDDEKVYNKVNQTILDLYLESVNNE